MNYQKLIRILIVFVLTISFSITVFSAALHKYHTSLTRMDYNAKDKLIEITIQLFTHDLVPVLEKQSRQKVDLGKESEIDQILFEYIKENFILKDEKEAVQELSWVGKEIKVDQVFVYVEIPFDKNSDNLKLKNSMFFESFTEQTNLVIFNLNEKKADLFYKAGDNFKDIKFSQEKMRGKN